MMLRVWILVAAFAAPPTLLAAQALDSIRAHQLAMEMAHDIRSLERFSDLQFISRYLPRIGAFFGIKFELPADREFELTWAEANLDVVFREHGTQAVLNEASRLDEERGHDRWKPRALEMIARQKGPVVALDAAHERDLLESAFDRLLNSTGLTGIEEVLTWIADNELEPELRLRLRARTLQFGSFYRPFRFWQRADSLPEPYRTQVRVGALTSTADSSAVPAGVLEVELPKMMEVASRLELTESREVLRAVAVACGRRQMEICEGLDLPMAAAGFAVGSDVVNLVGKGAYDQATNRLEQLRRTEPPLVVARRMAQGLESLGRSCRQGCDLVRADSLATEWLGEILSVEAEAIAGRIERTATWNGRDDLTELQRSLGGYLSTRDLDAVRELLGRMEDAGAIGKILLLLIQTAPEIDLVGAVEVYLDFIPDGEETPSIHYSDLIRTGRPDLAAEMLSRASPRAAMSARIDWVRRLTRAGRLKEVQTAMRSLISESTYQSPAEGGALLETLQSLALLEEYLAHIRALPTPLERVHGLFPLILAWVQGDQSMAISEP